MTQDSADDKPRSGLSVISGDGEQFEKETFEALHRHVMFGRPEDKERLDSLVNRRVHRATLSVVSDHTEPGADDPADL